MSGRDAPHGPGRRAVLAGLAGAAALAGAPAPAAATTTPSPAGADDALPLHVAVVDVTPTTYAADDPARSLIAVRARVRNDGGEALEGLRARLVAQRSPVVARSSLDRWESADADSSLGRAVVSSDDADVTAGGLRPGEEAEVLLTLEASELGGGEGAHPAAVEVVTGDGERAGLARTFLVSTPAGVRTTLLTLLLPLVAGRVREADGLAEEVAGRLGRLVEASGDPRTSWALDPAVLADVFTPPFNGTEAGDGTAVGEAAPLPPAVEVPAQAAALPPGTTDPARTIVALATWRERLAAAAAGRCVVALPHGDPDLTALTAVAAGAELLAEAGAAGVDVATSLDAATVLTGVSWPVDEDAGTEVLTLAARAGATTVVLDDEALPTRDELTYTPTGRADVEAGTGAGTTLTGLIADSALSQLLQRAAVPASPEVEDVVDDEVAGSLVQRVLAEVATITLQRPSDPRSLLVVAARSFDPRPAVVQRVVAAVEASGWASWQSLPDLLATPVPDVERAAAPEPDTVSLRPALPGAHVVAVRDALATLAELREALDGTAPATGAAQRSALMLLAASWRGHLPELRSARAGLQEDAAALLRAVHVLPGSVLNLAATRTELPVTIVNELFAPVRVELVLRPRSPRVQLEAVPAQTVPARGQVRVGVPVRALANGSVVVEAQLRTPSGLPLGEPVGLDVNVRADLEGWLTGLVGGGAGALLVVGLVRAVRRGRRRVDAVPHADVSGDTDGTTDGHEPPGAAGDGERRERPSAPTGQG
ncbi:DUF6049 family protein [Paenibacillus sp. TRM 82003]|uniref:DUF6049 family protein n=1 Tax=Kineococcus sp. TRM81007 TaxID=2925831 RepID=UPI001F571A4F|nr:DUF6049 family protein [Kineococcus sp. TRM81007]MCI2240522.1 DUF6049 family protein [Kineococcus sp. TRM81007]MCI3918901.1 DUF6049 family protein [Paenibacillus sp. TRM 82003]